MPSADLDEERVALGGPDGGEVADKLGSGRGHRPNSGPGGMIGVLDGLPAKRKILIHINNTNPILDVDSPERAELAAHGIDAPQLSAKDRAGLPLAQAEVFD